VCSYPLAIDKIPLNAEPIEWLGYIHPSVVSAFGSSAAGIVCVSFMDSTYLYDVAHADIQPLFHPPGTYLSEAPDDTVLIYAPGGFKCYVVGIGSIGDA